MDFTFVALKHILSNPNRKRVKIIVMSATLNAQEFANYFSIHKKNQTLFLPAIVPKVREIRDKD
jgi:HrpA-like RNA helicase